MPPRQLLGGYGVGRRVLAELLCAGKLIVDIVVVMCMLI